MSAEATGWVFRHSPYKGAAFAVHLAIADSVNDQHEDRFWMRQARLAEKARVGRGAVNEAIARMIDDGLLEMIEDRHAQGRPNEYRLLMPTDVAEIYARTLSSETTRGARHGDKGVSSTATRGVVVDDKRNPSVNPTDEPKNDARAALTLVDVPAGNPDGFDAFWSAYPRKAGKPAAERAWRKAIAKTGGLAVLDGLEPWLAYWRHRNAPEFIPYPQKWLNQRQWEDKPPGFGRPGAPSTQRPIITDRSQPSRILDLST